MRSSALPSFGKGGSSQEADHDRVWAILLHPRPLRFSSESVLVACSCCSHGLACSVQSRQCIACYDTRRGIIGLQYESTVVFMEQAAVQNRAQPKNELQQCTAAKSFLLRITVLHFNRAHALVSEHAKTHRPKRCLSGKSTCTAPAHKALQRAPRNSYLNLTYKLAGLQPKSRPQAALAQHYLNTMPSST